VHAPDPTPADELETLAEMVRRLRYDFHRPEDYYEQRSEIAGSLMRLSRRLTGRVPAPRAIAATLPPRPRLVAPPPAPRVLAAPTPPAPPVSPTRPPRPWRRHRYPRPPLLPAEVQARLPIEP
jgi:hypothetical protein